MSKAMAKPRPKGRGGRKSTSGGGAPDQVFREFAWNLAGTLAKPASRIGTSAGAGETKP